tara:strand:- start:57 stop:1142 length:1086 start_codon:yes stop_codon:yes gene_type:complete
MSSFRKKFTEINNTKCDQNILKQGVFLKKKREGFTSFLDKQDNITEKTDKWKSWYSIQNGNTESSKAASSVDNYIYHTDLYSRQYDKLADALKKCRKKCNVDISPPNGQKSEACKAGCHLAFPKYSEKKNTFVKKETESVDCSNITDDICKGGQVKTTNTDIPILTVLGKDNVTTPLTGCYKCGGGIWGRPIYRNSDGSIVTDCEGTYKESCRSGKNMLDTEFFQMTDDELASNQFGNYKPEDSDGEKERTLGERYKKMETSNEKMLNTYSGITNNFEKMDTYIMAMSNSLNTKYKDTVDDNKQIKLNLKGYLENLNKHATYSGRLEDSLLKRESLIYKNWAFGILAISLFCVAISKIRKI